MAKKSKRLQQVEKSFTPHVVELTAQGREALESSTLTRLYRSILTHASSKPPLTITQVARKVRIDRDTALTTEQVCDDIAELQSKGLIRVHQ